LFILLVNYCFTLFECLNSSWNKNHRKRKSNNKKLKKRIFCIRKKIRNPHFLALDTARRSSPPDPSAPWSSTETPRSPEYAENLSEPDWQRPCLSRSQAGNLCQRSRPLEEYQPPSFDVMSTRASQFGCRSDSWHSCRPDTCSCCTRLRSLPGPSRPCCHSSQPIASRRGTDERRYHLKVREQ